MDVKALFASTRAESRAYQERIVEQVFNGFTEKNYRSILIDSPTGSGKTVMALAGAAALQRHAGARVGWVAMRRNLLAQANRENEDMGFGVEMTTISMFDKKPPTNFDLLVVDEAQHDVTGSMGHLHALIKPRWVLGLSATPYRADRVKLCFDKVIKDAGIHRLIQDGFLSEYYHYSIPSWEPDTVVQYYAAERGRWGKSLIYFHRLSDCWRAWQLFWDHGVSCDVVYGNSDCEKQLRAFEEGKVQVLINCMKLGEGFNAPDLQTVWCRPSVKSVTVQMAGRVLRKWPALAVKQVVQSVDTRWNFCRTAGAKLMYTHVDGQWRSLQPNEMTELVARKALVALAQADSKIPELLTKSAMAGRNQRRRRGAGARGRIDPQHSFLHHDNGRWVDLNAGNEIPGQIVHDVDDRD